MIFLLCFVLCTRRTWASPPGGFLVCRSVGLQLVFRRGRRRRRSKSYFHVKEGEGKDATGLEEQR